MQEAADVAQAKEFIESRDERYQTHLAEGGSNLSGGQKQRVAIARALSMNANLLLCDEATSALDPNTTQSVLNLLRELNQKLGITIVVVTHQMEVVRQICDTISILENGKISASGNVKEIFLKKSTSIIRVIGERL